MGTQTSPGDRFSADCDPVQGVGWGWPEDRQCSACLVLSGFLWKLDIQGHRNTGRQKTLTTLPSPHPSGGSHSTLSTQPASLRESNHPPWFSQLPFAFVHLEYNNKHTLCPKTLFHVLPDTPTVLTWGSLHNTWNCTSTTSPPTSGSQAPGSLPEQIHPTHALGVTQPHSQEPSAWPASSLTQKRHRKPPCACETASSYNNSQLSRSLSLSSPWPYWGWEDPLEKGKATHSTLA